MLSRCLHRSHVSPRLRSGPQVAGGRGFFYDESSRRILSVLHPPEIEEIYRWKGWIDGKYAGRLSTSSTRFGGRGGEGL